MNWASVPKTSIDKDGDPHRRKHEIRIAEYLRLSPPADNSLLAEYADESQFGCMIAPASHPGHYFRSLLPRENIRHASAPSSVARARARDDQESAFREFDRAFLIVRQPGEQ